MKWFELKLAVPEPLKESVVNRLFELGAEGVSETDNPPLVNGFFDESRRVEIEHEISIYVASLATMFPQYPAISIETAAIKEENWADNYKQFYKAQKLTDIFFLKPAWDNETKVPEEMIPIVMDPGQAFGTGLHASTRMAMRLIEYSLNHYADPKPLRVLDVGTGSAILAIAACKLGVGHVEAFDIDAEAVEVANENLVRNGCGQVTALCTELSHYKEPVDILISNILLETHRELVADYRRLLKPGGQLILSGLLTHQKTELHALFLQHGFKREVEESMQEWAAVSYTWREHDA